VNPRVVDILARANSVQRDYVRARLIYDSLPKAAKAIHIHRTTPHKWDNLGDLEEAIEFLKDDMIEATKLALEGLSLEAVASVARVLKNRDDSAAVAAARAVWDRIGLPGLSTIDVTSGGEMIRAVVYIPDNGRDQDDQDDQDA